MSSWRRNRECRWTGSGACKSLIRNMKRALEDSDFELPDSLKKVLRGYQKKGFFWLKTLCQNSFGGILADDMGLGKNPAGDRFSPVLL